LLGLLAIQPGQIVSRDEIVDALWGPHPPESCRSLIHTYILQLRKLLEPERAQRAPARALVLTSGGYQLEAGPDQLDVVAFNQLTNQAQHARRSGDLDRAHSLLGRGLSVWRGPVLADLDSGLRQHPAAVALSQRRLMVALAYADRAISLGRGEEAVGALLALGHDEPYHEGLHARLMLALASCGQQAGALQVFADLRARLADELGIDVGPEVQAAQLSVLRQDLPVARDADEAGSGHSRTQPPDDLVPAQLPQDVGGFSGRLHELDWLDRLLNPDADVAGPVITTIVGPAGVGKTALAVHWAHQVRGRFPDGQLYVNLRGYASTSPMRPIEALAGFLHALGVAADRVPVEQEQAAALYRTLLADRRVLVALDNAHGPDQVRPLLPAGAGCLALVTSRDRLSGLVAREGANRLILDILSLPESRMLLARTLGVERVQAEPEATADLAQACGFLPLALRIAAARLTEYEQTLTGYVATVRRGDRLVALEVEGDELAAVGAAFDLSYAALAPDARLLFRLFGVAPGHDMTAESAAALLGSTQGSAARLLEQLSDAHLLGQQGPGRFAPHDLLRLYAAKRALHEDGEDACRTAIHRLLSWYLQGVDAAANLLYPERLRLPLPPAGAQPATDLADHEQALAWLDAERANLVACVGHASAHGPRPAAWQLADALHGYFWSRMYVVDWLAVARAGLVAAEAEGELRGQAAAHLSIADAHLSQSRNQRAVEHFAQALMLSRRSGWLDGQATALANLAAVDGRSGRLREAFDHQRQALALHRQTGRLGGQAGSLCHLGIVSKELGHLGQAADYLTESLALYRSAKSRVGEAVASSWLGETLHALGRLDQALDHFADALTLAREVGDRGNEAETLCGQALVHRDAGRQLRALELAHAALLLTRETGERQLQADSQIALASIQLRLGQPELAVGQYQQALKLARLDDSRYPQGQALIGLAAAQQRLGQTDQARSCAQQALALARLAGYRLVEGQALTALADLHQACDQPDQAIDLGRQALAVHRETGHRAGEASTLVILGRALNQAGQADAARDHWREALAMFTDMGLPDAENARWLLDEHPAEGTCDRA
jgi:DNA-binding SARP family transcriptional activator/tetratricopeptide (TPR) repeat protein